MSYIVYRDDELYHHGIKGQKWGVRRFQNSDGSLTAAGRERYLKGSTNRVTGLTVGKSLPKRSSSDAPEDILADAKKINGGRDVFKYGFDRDRNCAFCSVSYEARRRGIDVQAQASLRGVSLDKIDNYYSELYSNYKTTNDRHIAKREKGKDSNKGMTPEEYDSMVSDILTDGKNSRGQIVLTWKGNFGSHALNYEVKDGKFHVVDPQVGEAYSGEDAKRYMSNAINVRTTRTDNLRLNTETMMKKYSENSTAKIPVSKLKKVDNILTKVWGGSLAASWGLTAISTLVPGLAPIALGASLLQTALSYPAHTTFVLNTINTQAKTNKLRKQWKREGRKDWY